jgi:predicted NBD/HSP70 family sugar kinase
VGGVVDPHRGAFALAPNLPGLGRQGLIGAIRDELGTGVTFENDVNLAALGELAKGAGRGVGNFVFLFVGTGVGMGIVIGGELYRGTSGAAGEIGYMPLGEGDPHDRAVRRRGQLETSASAAAVVRSAQAAGVPPPLTAKRVFWLAERGERNAVAVVKAEARRIALAVAAVAPVLDPELVILGGGIGGNRVLVDPVEAELRQISPFRPRIEISQLGEEAVLSGALATALAAAQERVFSRAPDPERREIVV